jgi:3-oxoacyl-[acyl-carrier protein] reductase
MILKGKRVLVSGGSHGLGRALCLAFSSHGADVAFNYATSSKQALETQLAIEKNGSPCKVYQTSVLDLAGLRNMVADLESTWGGIDILVNNAGISQMLPIALLEEEDWDNLMDVNVKGVYLLTRAVLRGMIRKRAGRILNIGSLAGLRIIDAPAHYAASKAAIKGLTMSLAKEIGRYNITVNSIAPGVLEGGVAVNIPEYRVQEYVQNCSLGRVGSYDEIAEMAAFMVSDDNSYMNGFTLVMDGGL